LADQDLRATESEIARQRLESSLAAHNIVHACESLLVMISNLKMAHLLYDYERLSNANEVFTRSLSAQTEQNNAAIAELDEKIQVILSDVNRQIS